MYDLFGRDLIVGPDLPLEEGLTQTARRHHNMNTTPVGHITEQTAQIRV